MVAVGLVRHNSCISGKAPIEIVVIRMYRFEPSGKPYKQVVVYLLKYYELLVAGAVLHATQLVK